LPSFPSIDFEPAQQFVGGKRAGRFDANSEFSARIQVAFQTDFGVSEEIFGHGYDLRRNRRE
jgi:hypothetical protein